MNSVYKKSRQVAWRQQYIKHVMLFISKKWEWPSNLHVLCNMCVYKYVHVLGNTYYPQILNAFTLRVHLHLRNPMFVDEHREGMDCLLESVLIT